MFPKMIELIMAPRVQAEAQNRIFHWPMGVMSLQVNRRIE